MKKPHFAVPLCLLLTVCEPGIAQAQTTGNTDRPQAYLAVPADPIDYYRKLLRAEDLLAQQKWGEAETLLREVISAYPLATAAAPNHSPWGELGMTLQKQGKHAEAIRAYDRVIALQGPGLAYPGVSNALYQIAVSDAALGNRDATLATLDRMVRTQAYVARPDLLTDETFASLRNDPRFREIAGAENISGLDRIAGWRRDIDYMVAELRRVNPAGATIPKVFYARVKALKILVPRLNDEQIAMGISKAMNVLDRGHTAVWFGDTEAGTRLDYRPLPVRLYAFPEGLFVTEGWQGSESLAGAEVLKIGNTPAAEALRRAGAAKSNESPMEILWAGPQILVRPGVLKGLGLSERADAAELTLKTPDGIIATRRIHVRAEPPPDQWRRKLNAPPKVNPPLWLENVKRNHWLKVLPGRDAIYAQVNNIDDDPDETMQQFGITLRQALAESKMHNLILDLRHNNGGNTFRYIELLRTIIAFSTIEDNHVYVLIGRGIYSAAANLTADLERLVRPVFVGEPTSGTGNQYGDESRFVLPYSKLVGAHSGARWQLSHPWDERRSIMPQVPVQLTAKAYFAGEDPVLETVLRIIAEVHSAPAPKFG
jgi:tetratricopeptide (TPR) repeat protein